MIETIVVDGELSAFESTTSSKQELYSGGFGLCIVIGLLNPNKAAAMLHSHNYCERRSRVGTPLYTIFNTLSTKYNLSDSSDLAIVVRGGGFDFDKKYSNKQRELVTSVITQLFPNSHIDIQYTNGYYEDVGCQEMRISLENGYTLANETALRNKEN